MPDNDDLQSKSLADLVRDIQESGKESAMATEEALARSRELVARQRRHAQEDAASDKADKGEGD